MKQFAGLLCVLLLVGCAAHPVVRGNVSPAQYSEWQFNGRMSLTRGEQGWHAGLLWQERMEEFLLKVSGPLGQGGFQMQGNAGGVQLEDATGNVYTEKDPDALLVAVTGWNFPVAGMRYWVRGLPAPQAEARVVRDEQGHLKQLDQSGWTIHFTRYQSVDATVLPTKLQLTQGDLTVRLVISQWQLGPAVNRSP